MNSPVAALGLVLVVGACSAKSVAIQQPHPQSRDSLQSDTMLARVQSDSALARIVDSLGLSLQPRRVSSRGRIKDSLGLSVQGRGVCPMPVLRGDGSHDRRMVLKLPRSRPMQGLPQYSVCYNPLFRDSS